MHPQSVLKASLLQLLSFKVSSEKLGNVGEGKDLACMFCCLLTENSEFLD